MVRAANGKKQAFAILLDQDPDYCLQCRGGYPRANISLGTYQGNDCQVWTFEDGYLKPARNQNLCINIAKIHSQRPSGTNIQLFTKFSNNSPFQKWTYENNQLKLQAKIRGHEEKTFVIDLRHNRIEEGQNIHLFEENGTTAQEWQLQPIDYEHEIEDSDDELMVEAPQIFRGMNQRRNDANDDRMLRFAMRRGVQQKRTPRRMTKMDAIKLEAENKKEVTEEKGEEAKKPKAEEINNEIEVVPNEVEKAAVSEKKEVENEAEELKKEVEKSQVSKNEGNAEISESEVISNSVEQKEAVEKVADEKESQTIALNA